MSKLFNQSSAADIINVFNKVKDGCQAYENFLDNRNFSTATSVSDIPISDKDNYFRKYSLLEKMYKNTELSDYYMICSSSGSTGEPTFWPRDSKKDDLAEPGHTAFLDEHFDVLKKRSLIVIALDLGSTTAGIMHTRLSIDLAKKSKTTVITPGCRPDDIVAMVSKLYSHYDQVILLSYPTVVNEILDLAGRQQLPFFNWNLKVAYTGSGASDLWRLELIDKYKIKGESIISFYGCTETGFIGSESRAVNNLINLCLQDKSLTKKIFGSDSLPTIVDNFAPNKYFEIQEDELLLTVDQPIPLVRYNLHDEAAFISVKEIEKILKKEKVKVDLSVSKNDQWLVVYGRRRNTFFSLEDVQRAFYSFDSDVFLKEFQYKEKLTDNALLMLFVLYKKKGKSISKSKIKELKDILFTSFEDKHSCKIELTIKDETERIGYKSGKLSYFF